MKKIINGTLCNTETAKPLGEYENLADPTDSAWYLERLYVTRSGKYFLHGSGNAMSLYSKALGNGWTKGTNEIILLDGADAARKWAEEHFKADDYIAAFGNPDEGEKNGFYVSISSATRAKLDAERDRTGETLGEIVDRVLSGNL